MGIKFFMLCIRTLTSIYMWKKIDLSLLHPFFAKHNINNKMSFNWNAMNKQMIYQDYLFWHQRAKESQAIGNCQSAYFERMMSNSQWVASGNIPDPGHQTAAELMLKCAIKKKSK